MSFLRYLIKKQPEFNKKYTIQLPRPERIYFLLAENEIMNFYIFGIPGSRDPEIPEFKTPILCTSVNNSHVP